MERWRDFESDRGREVENGGERVTEMERWRDCERERKRWGVKCD